MMRFFNNVMMADRPCSWHGAVLLAAILAWGGAGAGCTKDHCESDEDCLAGEQCDLDTNRCYVVDVDAGDGGPDAGDAEPDAGDAEPIECTGHGECTEPAEPVCIDETCQPCTQPAQCAEKDIDRPLCEGGRCVECATGLGECVNPTPICNSSGDCAACANHQECIDRGGLPACDGASCVECTDSATHCGGATQICDPTSHTCRACEAHADCDFLAGPDTGVCDWDTSTCVDPANIIYVDDDAGCSDSGACDTNVACCTIAEALTRVGGTVSTILVADGSYYEITIHNQDVRIVGLPGAIIGPSNLDINVVTVHNLLSTDTTSARIEGFTIHNGSNTGIGTFCTGLAAAQPTLILFGNTITNNAGGGVSASNCTVTLEANDISANPGGGVYLSDSDFTVINNMITLNGGVSSTHGGVQIINPGTTRRFHSNTVVGNDAQAIEGGISCFPDGEVVSTIAYGNIGGDTAALCTVTDSWTTTDGTPAFVGGDDYHLDVGSPCINAGDTVDPPTHDFDGQVRDALPDIGADEYYP